MARRKSRTYRAPRPKRHPRSMKARGNPTLKRRMKASRARQKAADRRVATALAKYLRRKNPAVAGVRMQKLKDGVIKFTPIKNAAIYSKAQKHKMSARHIRLQDQLRKAKTRASQDRILAKLEALKSRA